MEKLIFELRLLRQTFLADQPTIDHVLRMNRHINLNLYTGRNLLLFWCKNDVLNALFTAYHDENSVYQNITDDQMSSLTEIMSFFLQQHNRSEDEILHFRGSACIRLILQLIVVLLTSNKRHECEAWVREHSAELMSLRTQNANSILHLVLDIDVGIFHRAPIVSLLVDEFKMDVNVQNVDRETPLHWLSKRVRFFSQNQMPSLDIRRVAGLLIDSGAHMDAVDVSGKEASHPFSRKFPQWSFNFKLSCLAAKAIIKHGVRYERLKLPASVVTFIQSHKPGTL